MYREPDFSKPSLAGAPECRFVPAPADTVLPDGFMSTTNFPTYVKIGGRWRMPERPRRGSRFLDAQPSREEDSPLRRRFSWLPRAEALGIDLGIAAPAVGSTPHRPCRRRRRRARGAWNHRADCRGSR